MQLKLGSVYCGFTLVDQRKIGEVNSKAWVFTHEQSGARLLFLENEDDNKVFSVSFRTPPEDSTGLPHILEHSVLCGSRKFPSKEPFVELVKGSLNTFLNAMTFPDKTMYPVASKNEKDFRNLMDVYLDAVFYPNIYQHPEIMMQEGWHYELEEKTADLTYKGVVYNEMKGAFSSPEALLQRRVSASLFPDTPYGFESGGDPDKIPQLTQEQFAAFHRKYYHPANSFIFLYGNLDIEDTLRFLDEAYLSAFDKTRIDSAIPMQKPFAGTMDKELEYPVSSAEKVEDKTFFSLNYVVGTATDPENYLAVQILEHLLLGTPAAPLKKALIESGIGKDASGVINESILQPTFSIRVSGSNPDQKDRFLKVIAQTLEQLVTEGIDKRLVESSINVFEFQLREANYEGMPKGLIYNMRIMDSWLYDSDPLAHLAYEPALARIKSALTTRYFEKLIEQCLLNNPHSSLVTLKPRQGMEEAKNAALRKHLAQYKQKLSDTELDMLVKQTKRLQKRQETPDTPEALAKIPLLNIKDISPIAESLPLVKKQENGAVVLFHPQFTNQIAYVNLYFDTGSVPQDLLPYLYLLARMIGKVDTSNYDYSALSNEINIHTGGITYDVTAYSAHSDDARYYPKFLVEAKALVEQLPQLFELLSEIINHSQFDNEKRLKELVQETKAAWESSISSYGQIFVSTRILGYFSPVAQYTEQGLLTFYQFILDLEKNLPAKVGELRANLKKVFDLVFQKDNLLVSVATEEENYGKFQACFPPFYASLPRRSAAPVPYKFALAGQNEGLMTSSKVQTVAKAANYRRLGFDYHGSMKVLETILRYDYLWNRIRVKGGAYGGSAKFERNGNMVFFSYRDPNLAETLKVYDQMASYLHQYDAGDREMTKYIIGTIGRLDVPLTPPMKTQRATEHYIRGISQTDRQKERDEVLYATPEAIRRLADVVEAAMRENYLCVMGSEEKIKANQGVFGELRYVFE